MPKVSDEYVEARREQILAASRRCFAREGFHATTMPDILSEAGLSSGAVYRYFASKDDIIVAIGQDNLRSLAAAVRDVARSHAGAGPGSMLGAILDFVRRRNRHDHLGAMALLVWSESLRNDTLARALRSTFTEVRRAIVQALESNQSSTAAGANPEDVAALMVSILAGYLFELVVLPPSASSAVPEAAVSLLHGWQ